jgi:hypothetical protein
MLLNVDSASFPPIGGLEVGPRRGRERWQLALNGYVFVLVRGASLRRVKKGRIDNARHIVTSF